MIFRLSSLAFLFLFSLSAIAIDEANIQVNSSGSVQAIPDFINIEISIEKTDKIRSTAKRKADLVTQQVLDITTAMNVKEEHVHASELFIYPEYRWQNQVREHLGEKATRTVRIKLYGLEDYSELAEKLVNVEITRMHQQGFGFDNIEEHRNKAIIQALERAKTKANVIAGEIGRKVTSVFQVSESTSQPGPVHRQMGVAMMAEAVADPTPAPLEVKSQTVNANVHVVFLVE